MPISYWIAQHVADVFRNEPRNVGVIVSDGERVHARFFGEDEEGRLDGRRLKKLEYPEVYRQWVSYWRRDMRKVDSIMQRSTGNYRVLPGGEVSGVEATSLGEVADYLYTVLVSEGAISEALQGKEVTEAPWVQLESEVARELSEENLLEVQDELVHYTHPIRRNASIQGRAVIHRPAFSQMNGRLTVIETSDLTITSRRKQARDHAGFVAYMFRDIGEYVENSVRISIVRVTQEDLAVEEVDYAMRALRSESDVVNWIEQAQKAEFLAERRRIAA